MTKKTFDVIVVGGGAGGVPAAIRAAQLGARVALIEEKFLGGLCMNRGCIPFGHMMAASRILENLSLGKEMGIECTGIATDYATLMKRQKALISFMREGVHGMLKKHNIHMFKGRGKLNGEGNVTANGENLSGKKIILATGAKWIKPDFPGGDLKEVSNSDYLLTAKRLPQRCLLFGSSPWILKIAQFLHRFGAKVLLVTKEKSLLHNESRTIRSRFTKALKSQGIEIRTKTKIQEIKKKKSGLHAVLSAKNKSEAVEMDRIITLKRSADFEDIGLHTVGLHEESDFITVNDRMETAKDGIYAIGDLSAPEIRHYSHLASSGGIIAAENAMGLNRPFDIRADTRMVFTQPQVACIGLTKKEAKKAGYEVVVGSAPLSMNPFGMILSQNEGIVEIVAEKKYGEVLGVHILGEGACEMAGQAALAIQMEITLEELANAAFPHPTLSESLPEAARECLGQAIYLP
jgi:dihydrolipoamide dehydrogenase